MRQLLCGAFIACGALVVSALAIAGPADATSDKTETAAERGYRLLTTKAYNPPEFSQETFESLWQAWPEPLRAPIRCG